MVHNSKEKYPTMGHLAPLHTCHHQFPISNHNEQCSELYELNPSSKNSCAPCLIFQTFYLFLYFEFVVTAQAESEFF